MKVQTNRIGIAFISVGLSSTVSFYAPHNLEIVVTSTGWNQSYSNKSGFLWVGQSDYSVHETN
ncbi:MAG: hypothetical protein ISR95_04135 [Candidatus Marinimicrobia bacterium]|nr:hypothetical protein [Candidatus Neomarinimicrobiota bacterium]